MRVFFLTFNVTPIFIFLMMLALLIIAPIPLTGIVTTLGHVFRTLESNFTSFLEAGSK